MLKKIAVTFLKFFLTFVSILLAFSISFCVIFGKNTENSNSSENSQSNQTEKNPIKNNGTEEEKDVSENFLTFFSSFLKVILMLSGEYTVEPYTLVSVGQWVFFFMFVLTTYILFNLILGLTIDDVQKLRDDTRALTLRHEAKKFIESSKIYLEIYNKYR